ncbi:putative PEP-binding protein [Amycolatopsis sp. WQ 127309]|uniref:putative PEP-binding protein n=1 Tax=Amycolatopsis sp. WQ 127309 TaxID=2932773 RepID=UPI001FF14464|nr:putative PEP-binding protein [Amycolatopsis sp. WQ 127309]UOZ06398.1 PEP-utilizing enzyme [Amycolatopsis sp. WQ 127309]
MPRPGLREIPGSLLVGSPRASVRGLCNRTGKPIEGTVLVAETLGPDLYDAIVVSAAVICARGGRTGHMQSLCRSRGIPVLRVDAFEPDAFVGEVTIRVDRESVVLGGVDAEPQRARLPGGSLDTLESICVVISDAADIRSTNDLAPLVEQVNCFFVREEFVCFSAGLSPVDALRAGDREAERYGEAIAAELCTMVKELVPGQRLVMRLLDLRSDDAARITTGVAVAEEPNPELGLHGARWLLAEGRYPRAFRALRAYLQDRLGWDAERVGFAVPFINDEDEFLRLRRHLGLPGDTPLGVFLETPAAVHSTAGFFGAGANELFIGTKDLIQFYLAADRGNHLVASSYETRHPAVLAALRGAVESCRETGLPLHVFVLGADVDHYLRQVPTRTLMMCTAELAQLAHRRAGPASTGSGS